MSTVEQQQQQEAGSGGASGESKSGGSAASSPAPSAAPNRLWLVSNSVVVLGPVVDSCPSAVRVNIARCARDDWAHGILVRQIMQRVDGMGGRRDDKL